MWQCHVKNALLMIWTGAFLATAPAITFMISDEFWKGLAILITAVVLGTLCFPVACYQHKSGIHATPVGFISALLFFIVGTVWLWLQGFYFWIPALLLALPIVWGYLTGKNK